MNPFFELTIIFLVTFFIALIFRVLKQPLIISYLVSGLVLGLLLSSFFEREIIIETFSEIGIALLLFIVGLELKLKTLREVGVPSLIIGGLQEIVTIFIGFLIAKLIGFSDLSAFYLGAALSFSSTVIVIKLITDKGDLEKNYGKLAVGFLLVQDLITILIIIGLTFFQSDDFSPALISFEKILLGLGLIFLIPYFSHRLIAKSENFLAKSLEFLFIFSLAFGFAIASLFEYLGFGVEIGALIAGVSLSSLITSSEIASRLKPLRDFFLVLFFIAIGSQIVITEIQQFWLPILIFSLFVLIGNPLIMFILLGFLGYRGKTMFLLGLTSAQISEFSFILFSLGIDMKHIQESLLSLLSVIGLITIFLSTYLFTYAENVYPFLKDLLKIFERKMKKEKKEIKGHYEIILFGSDRIGSFFVEVFNKNNFSFLVVDYNLEIVKRLQSQGINVFYGDASEIDTLNDLNFKETKLLVSTIPDFQTNILILTEYRKFNKNGICILTATNNQDAIELYQYGVDYVIMPYFLGGEHAAHLISKHLFNKEEYSIIRENHISHIRRKLINHHTNI
ncbi:MAG: cation:proton antiporter [Patescibacteria group bacterium]|nr:cation:proton antiporter [Patescibacteria group bacterium]